jgi:hypothetical protein
MLKCTFLSQNSVKNRYRAVSAIREVHNRTVFRIFKICSLKIFKMKHMYSDSPYKVYSLKRFYNENRLSSLNQCHGNFFMHWKCAQTISRLEKPLDSRFSNENLNVGSFSLQYTHPLNQG